MLNVLDICIPLASSMKMRYNLLGDCSMKNGICLTVPFLIAFIQIAPAADTVNVPVKDLAIPYSVNTKVYTQDGLRRIDGCSDGVIRIYDIADTTVRKQINPGGGSIRKIVLTFDNTGFFALKRDSSIARVQLAAGAFTNCLIAKPAAWNAVIFSNDANKVISFDPKDSSFSVSNLTTGKTSACLTGIWGRVEGSGVAFSSDGNNVIAVMPKDSSAQLRNLDSDSILRNYKISGAIVNNVITSPNGRQCAVPTFSGYLGANDSIIIIDLITGNQSLTVPARTNDRSILLSWDCSGFAFSNDGLKIVASDNIVFGVWELSSQKCLIGYKPCSGSSFKSWLTPDSKSVVCWISISGTYTDSLIQWDLQTLKKNVLFAGQALPRVKASGFSESGEVLCIGTYSYEKTDSYVGLQKWDSTVFWNEKTGKEFKRRDFGSQSPGSSYFSGWIFGNDGKNLFEKLMNHRSSTLACLGMSLHGISDTGKTYFFPSIFSQEAVSLDKKLLYAFSSNSYMVLNVNSLDTIVRPLSMPVDWEILAVHPQKNLACAIKKEQKSQFDNIVITAGIWNLNTDTCTIQFWVTSFEWLSPNTGHLIAEFMPDGEHIIFQSDGHFSAESNTIAKYNVKTGTLERTYPVNGSMNFALTPDGKMLLAGIRSSDKYRGMYCFDASTGDLLRYYNAPFNGTEYFSSPFSFNPVNPRQFINITAIWELPWAIPVNKPVSFEPNVSFRVLKVKTNRMFCIMPATNAEASISLYRLDGRMVRQFRLMKNSASLRSIDLHGLAPGLYMYHFSTVGNIFHGEGSFLIP